MENRISNIYIYIIGRKHPTDRHFAIIHLFQLLDKSSQPFQIAVSCFKPDSMLHLLIGKKIS